MNIPNNTVGMQHQPLVLRQKPELVEGVHYQVVAWVAYFLDPDSTQKPTVESK